LPTTGSAQLIFSPSVYSLSKPYNNPHYILQASLPLDEIHDFYQRMAAADMIHWTQHLPLFTVFHGMAADKSKVLLDSATVNAGIQAIYTQSDILAEVAYEYLPLEVGLSPITTEHD
jgi:hypothetical protein